MAHSASHGRFGLSLSDLFSGLGRARAAEAKFGPLLASSDAALSARGMTRTDVVKAAVASLG